MHSASSDSYAILNNLDFILLNFEDLNFILKCEFNLMQKCFKLEICC